jgi:D-sedoheptulose 7-phosphate isomerase
MEKISEYFEDLDNQIILLDKNKISTIIKVIEKAIKDEKKIFIIGNGGSAALSSHLACDITNGAYRSNKIIKILSLNDNVPIITALANDIGYNNIFAYQLVNLMDEGDILIAISGSGKSENILKAVKFAKNNGAKVISLTGFSGGKLKKVSDYNINIDSKHYGVIEDLHSIICHIIAFRIGKHDE